MSAAVLALLVASALPAPPPAAPAPCVVVEVVARGRGAHGATVMLHAAPHRLVRALDRLPAWQAASRGIEARIVALTAASAVNVIPPRAAARIELWLAPGAAIDEALRDLGRTLGSQVETRALPAACGPESAR